MMKLVICILMGMFSCSTLFAQELCDSVKIHFRQGRTELDMNQGENARLLHDIQPLEVSPWVVLAPEEPEKQCYYWALKTNLLYDAALVPNIGAEFYWGKNWSVGANLMYAWWKNGASNKFWRIYGGDIYARKWFGQKAEENPFAGHHAGVYAQMLTYDFCLGDKGYMGGQPGGNIWDKLSFAVGVEYGYSLPIASRLNLDFTIGIGYLQGVYQEYISRR